jgi:hypothetical protein
LDWWIAKETPAHLIAFVDLESRRVWLFTLAELVSVAQQQPGNRLHFFMAVDPTTVNRRDGKAVHDHAFAKHLIENSIHGIFFDPVFSLAISGSFTSSIKSKRA